MAQENTQGIARKLSIAKSFPLDDGLLPTLRLAISFIGVTLVKKSSKSLSLKIIALYMKENIFRSKSHHLVINFFFISRNIVLSNDS